MTRFRIQHQGRDVPLAGVKASIGSGDDCDLQISGAGVESQHAVIEVKGGEVVLTSKVTGELDVRVNGQAAHASEIEAGIELRFGEIELSLERSDEGLALAGYSSRFPLRAGLNQIGRTPEAAVSLDHESVSREHASIVILPSGETRIRDLGSSNGTWVGQRRLGQIRLADGDQVVIGDRSLVFSDSAPEASTPSQAEESASGPLLELRYDGESLALGPGTIQIGRAPDCEVPFAEDDLVSRYHAKITVEGTQATLTDMGSANGTWVNAERLNREHRLRDGDTIGIGKQELRFHAELPGADLGKTVLAQDLAGVAGETVLMPQQQKNAPSGQSAEKLGEGGPDRVGGPGEDRAAALALLDLRPDADDALIDRRYRELHSEFQVRLSNAPTAELRAKYHSRLEELRAAYTGLRPAPSDAGSPDLPSREPIAVSPEVATDGETDRESEDEAALQEAPEEPPTRPEQRGTESRKLPRSAIVMAVLGAITIAATVFCAISAFAALKTQDDVAAQLEAQQERIVELEALIPQTERELDTFLKGKATLLENLPFSICNMSSAPIYVDWLHTTWVNKDTGQFEGFRSDEWGYPSWPIDPGGTLKIQWVSGDQMIWDGNAIFFSMLFYYRGEEYFRSGALAPLNGACYALDLDQ